MKVYAYNCVELVSMKPLLSQKLGWFLAENCPNKLEYWCYSFGRSKSFFYDKDIEITLYLDSLIGDILNTEYREIEL